MQLILILTFLPICIRSQQYQPPGVNPSLYNEQRQQLLNQGPLDPKPPQPKGVLHRDVKHEADHVKEHLDVPLDTEDMSDQELQFHYFKMHDADGNNKLDGCELVKSLIHFHEDDEEHRGRKATTQKDLKIFSDQELSEMIDPILKSDDKNQDGYIDYPEFILAQLAIEESSI